MRRLSVGDLHQIVLADTVGFVSRLPHALVEAFHSTLEEICYSDLILMVADASAPEWPEQLQVTRAVIDQLGCADIPTLTVFNKCDCPHAGGLPGLCVSARTGEGLDSLLAAVSHELESRIIRVELLLPYDKLGLAADIRAVGNIQSEVYGEAGVHITAAVDRRHLAQFEAYVL